jgi:glycosyltransferase involved in cell wall biosynthesis
MTNEYLVSIIINNYNYGKFLRDAIESALGQSYPRTEVIVVDDGSTDESRTVMRTYGPRIQTIFKENGGQSSTFNTGFRLSQGQVICFLDADDMLHPRALERAVDFLRDPGVVKVQWPVYVIDALGRKTGRIIAKKLATGDLRNTVLTKGPGHYGTSPSSARAYARSFLEQVFPLPEIEKEFGIGAADWDDYLSMLAPLFGRLERLAQPSGEYRIHGNNDWATKPFAEKLRRDLRMEEFRFTALSHFCRRLGYPVDVEGWREQSWCGRLERAMLAIQTHIPAGAQLALIDEGSWLTDELFAGCRRLPFPERGGVYWGVPSDSAFAIREIERLRRAGVGWLVIGWSAFWWLDYYADFGRHLRLKYRVVLENPEVIIFDLGDKEITGRRAHQPATKNSATAR